MKIANDFGIFLPIIGGTGKSIESPLIIDKKIPVIIIDQENEFQQSPAKVERLYLECVFKGRGVKFKFLSQELIEHNGKMIDKLKCETTETTVTQVITQIENYYFDISDFSLKTDS